MTYTVKQVSEILGVDQETVRRWIRNGRLLAEKDSNKEGHRISDENLKLFLEKTPKNLARLSMGIASFNPVIAPVVGMATYAGGLAVGLAMTYLAEKKKQKVEIQSEDLAAFLQDNISKISSTILQKQLLIEQTQVEIQELQEQIRQYQNLLNDKDRLSETISQVYNEKKGTEK